LDKTSKNKGLIWVGLLIIIIALAVAYFWLKSVNSTIAVSQATVSAPEIDLTSAQGGILKDIYVNEGDMVPANTLVARVNNELIKTNSAGEITTINGDAGRNVAPGETVAIMINPDNLRVIGQEPENKGLNSIYVGQSAYFTVDAFGSQKFYGTVSEISPTADTSNMAFQSSGTRQTQNFDVKVSFNQTQYPNFKNGMSARIWIVK
jgi:multidrug resistance efflux pump